MLYKIKWTRTKFLKQNGGEKIVVSSSRESSDGFKTSYHQVSVELFILANEKECL